MPHKAASPAHCRKKPQRIAGRPDFGSARHYSARPPAAHLARRRSGCVDPIPCGTDGFHLTRQMPLPGRTSRQRCHRYARPRRIITFPWYIRTLSSGPVSLPSELPHPDGPGANPASVILSMVSPSSHLILQFYLDPNSFTLLGFISSITACFKTHYNRRNIPLCPPNSQDIARYPSVEVL